MALNKNTIGFFITPVDIKCNIPNLSVDDVSGINADKEFFEPSKQVGADTSKYKIVPNNAFACNLMHVGRDVVLPIALNHSGEQKIVSPAYSVFSFNGKGKLLPEYFFIMLKSSETDRFFWFHTDSSIRDGMSWEDFCNTEITFPNIEIQRKYVAIYHAIQENQRSYEQGLEDLKLVCEAYIEQLGREAPLDFLGKYIALSDEKNSSNLYDVSSVRGISIEKKFIETKADMTNVNLKNYNIIPPDYFAYVTVTSRNGEKISLALNRSKDTFICSGTYPVFYCIHTESLDPHYLNLILSREEFNRYARFHSWGSARETFDWDELCQVQIPIPDIQKQRAIASLFDVYIKRLELNESLKSTLKSICPILIRGAITEAKATA